MHCPPAFIGLEALLLPCPSLSHDTCHVPCVVLEVDPAVCSPPQVTYKRLRDTLRMLAEATGRQGASAGLVEVLFGQRQPRFQQQQPQAWTPFNAGMHSVNSHRAAESSQFGLTDSRRCDA